MKATILNRSQVIPTDGWYQIEVTGEHPAGDGRVQVIDEEAITSIINRFHAEKKEAGDSFAGMLVDRDHLSHDLDNETAAMAWVQDLANRDGQLHALLDLTTPGEAAVKGKVFKFFSTEYTAADLQDLGDGRVRPRRRGATAESRVRLPRRQAAASRGRQSPARGRVRAGPIPAGAGRLLHPRARSRSWQSAVVSSSARRRATLP